LTNTKGFMGLVAKCMDNVLQFALTAGTRRRRRAIVGDKDARYRGHRCVYVSSPILGLH